jgi:hypothetical protein
LARISSEYFQRIDKSPSSLFSWLATLPMHMPILRNNRWLITLNRYMGTTRLPFIELGSDVQKNPPVEIVFVSTRKDFNSLEKSIPFAIEATSNQQSIAIKIIVPEADLLLCNQLVAKLDLQNAKVISENTIVPEHLISALRARFGWRTGWVLQQILKVECVKNSDFPGVLIIDSDTLLLNRRTWLKADSTQLLSASWEYNASYYHFLNKKGLVDIFPEFTFVTHHMLMQPKFLIEALNFMGWHSLELLVDYLIKESNPNDDSPFCIEYELYGQYMFKFHRDLVSLQKWSNISVPPSLINENLPLAKQVSGWKDDFYSISLHSYLE